MMNRRDFIRRGALFVAAASVLPVAAEALERLKWKRKYWAGMTWDGERAAISVRGQEDLSALWRQIQSDIAREFIFYQERAGLLGDRGLLHV